MVAQRVVHEPRLLALGQRREAVGLAVGERHGAPRVAPGQLRGRLGQRRGGRDADRQRAGRRCKQQRGHRAPGGDWRQRRISHAGRRRWRIGCSMKTYDAVLTASVAARRTTRRPTPFRPWRPRSATGTAGSARGTPRRRSCRGRAAAQREEPRGQAPRAGHGGGDQHHDSDVDAEEAVGVHPGRRAVRERHHGERRREGEQGQRPGQAAGAASSAGRSARSVVRTSAKPIASVAPNNSPNARVSVP